MRIVFVTQGAVWSPGGSYRVIYEYANQFVALGREVLIVHPLHVEGKGIKDGSRPSRLRTAGTVVRRATRRSRPAWFRLDARVKVQTVRSVRHALSVTMDSDTLFATSWRVAEIVGQQVDPQAQRLAYLIHHDEGLVGYDAKRVRSTWLLKCPKVFVSRHVFDGAVSDGITGCHLVPNGLDHTRYRPLNDPSQRGPVVAMALVDKVEKDPRTAVAATGYARSRIPGLEVLAFGAGRRPDWLPAWVSYHQRLSDAELVSEIYNHASVFLSSSRFEGFCLPAAEAMACGAALVATDSGGIHEFARHGANALLVPPGDADALGKSLTRVLSDHDLRRELVRTGMADVARLDWRTSAQLMLDVLDAASGSVRT